METLFKIIKQQNIGQKKLEKRKEQLQRELEEKRARYLAEKKKEKNVFFLLD